MEPNGSKKTLRITGAENQPIEIEPGGYYYNTKARCQRIMRESLSPEAYRVHACLELATMGFHQELAVKMDRGKQVPLTPGDISRQTGLSKQHTRRAMVELENNGLAERRSDGSGSQRVATSSHSKQTLQRGKILIFSWALPRVPEAVSGSQRAATWDQPGLPPQFNPLLILSKRLRINLDLHDVGTREAILRDGEEIARNYQEAEQVAARFLKGVCAQTTKAPDKSVGRKIVKDRTHTPDNGETAPAAAAPVPAALVRVLSPPREVPLEQPKAQHQPKAVTATPKPEGKGRPKPGVSLKRIEEFIRNYPHRSDPDRTRSEYIDSNTADSEDACHACLARYLASDQVHRGITMTGPNWLKQQKRNNWAGDWARPRSNRSLQERADDYARRRREEKARAD